MTKNIVTAHVKLDAASCWDSSLKLEFTSDRGEHLSLLADRELALAQFSKSSIISAYQKHPLDLDAAFSRIFQGEDAEIMHRMTINGALLTQVTFGKRSDTLSVIIIPSYHTDFHGHMNYKNRIRKLLMNDEQS